MNAVWPAAAPASCVLMKTSTQPDSLSEFAPPKVAVEFAADEAAEDAIALEGVKLGNRSQQDYG